MRLTTFARTTAGRSTKGSWKATRSSARVTARGSTCGPAQATMMPAVVPVATYPVVVEDGEVLVGLPA